MVFQNTNANNKLHHNLLGLITGNGESSASIIPARISGVYDHSFSTLELYDNLNWKAINPVNINRMEL